MTVVEVDADLMPVEAERYLISLLTAYTARTLRDEALTKVKPHHFGQPTYRALWQGALALADAGKPLERRRIVAAAIEADPLPPVRGKSGTGRWEQTLLEALDAAAAVPPSPVDFPGAVEAVVQAGERRRLVQVAEQIRQLAVACDDPSEAFSRAVDLVGRGFRGVAPTGKLGLAQLLEQFEADQTDPYVARTVIPTPWDDLNDLLGGGLHGGRLYAVGGRPGGGKSLISGNIAAYAARQGYSTLVFSVEMSALEVVQRIVAAEATISMSEIVRRDLSSVSWDLYRRFADEAKTWPLQVVDRPNLTLGAIRAICREQAKTTGLDLVVIDYLQLVDPSNRTANRYEQIGEISRGLKALAKELGVGIVVPAQLNRRAERERPVLGDLRESGNIEQDCDGVVLLWREVYTAEDVAAGEATQDMIGTPTGRIHIDLAKNRQGPTGLITRAFRGEYARVE